MFYLGLWAAKFYYRFIEKRPISDSMGMVALRFCEKFLYKVAKPKTIIAVTGTNGKTTTCSFIADMLEKNGYKVAINRDGANLRAGLVKALILNTTIFNKTKADYAVLEFCEFHTGYLLDPIQPDYVVVTNLFSDTISDVGHVDYAFNCIDEGIPKKSTVILNADDLISSQLAKNHKKIFFSIQDSNLYGKKNDSLIKDIKVCPNCFNKLIFDHTLYHHLGVAHCDNCGFTNPKADYICHEVDTNKNIMVVNKKSYHLISNAVFNIYNQLVTIIIGDIFNLSNVNEAFKSIRITSSRYDEYHFNNKTVIAHLAKGENPIAISRAIDYSVSCPGKKDVVIILEDDSLRRNDHLEEIMTYLYQTDFELLNDSNINRIIIGGEKLDEIKLRLLLAGIDEKKIYCTKELDCYKYVDKNVDTVYILHSVANVTNTSKNIDNLKEVWK